MHNLVTALSTLASLVPDLRRPELSQLLHDPRYDLLLRDLRGFVHTLDARNITDVATALQTLDHKRRQPPQPTTRQRIRGRENWCVYGTKIAGVTRKRACYIYR